MCKFKLKGETLFIYAAHFLNNGCSRSRCFEVPIYQQFLDPIDDSLLQLPTCSNVNYRVKTAYRVVIFEINLDKIIFAF